MHVDPAERLILRGIVQGRNALQWICRVPQCDVIYVLVLLVEDVDYPISKTPWFAERDTSEVGKYRFAEERSPSECGIVAIS